MNLLINGNGGKLIQAHKEVVQTLHISAESKEFLIKVGLPQETSDMESLTFNLDMETFPYLNKLLNKTNISEEFTGMRKLGLSSSSYVCIDELNEGQIFIYYQTSNDRQFVNSDIQSLAKCILISFELSDMFEKEEKDYEKEEDRDFARNWYKEK